MNRCTVQQWERRSLKVPALWREPVLKIEDTATMRNRIIWQPTLPPGATWLPGLCCCQAPCLSLWPYYSQGPCSMSFVITKTIQKPEVWATTWGQADVQEPCCCQGQTNLGGLHCHLRACWLQPRAMCGSIAQLQPGSMMTPMLCYCQQPQDSWIWWPGHRSGPAPCQST